MGGESRLDSHVGIDGVVAAEDTNEELRNGSCKLPIGDAGV